MVPIIELLAERKVGLEHSFRSCLLFLGGGGDFSCQTSMQRRLTTAVTALELMAPGVWGQLARSAAARLRDNWTSAYAVCLFTRSGKWTREMHFSFRLTRG